MSTNCRAFQIKLRYEEKNSGDGIFTVFTKGENLNVISTRLRGAIKFNRGTRDGLILCIGT